MSYYDSEEEPHIGDTVRRHVKFKNSSFTDPNTLYVVTDVRYGDSITVQSKATGEAVTSISGLQQGIWDTPKFVLVQRANKEPGKLEPNFNHHGTTTGRITSKDTMNQTTATISPEKQAAAIIKEAEAATAAIIKVAEAAAAELLAWAAEADEKAAQTARLKRERELALATDSLLGRIGGLMDGGTVGNYAAFAKFRKELQPLAATYGVKIVLVGDKSQGTLVQM